MQDNILSFEAFKKSRGLETLSEEVLCEACLSPEEIAKLCVVRDKVEEILDSMTAQYRDPMAVAYAAGRFAAMRLYQMQGRAETMAFIDQCIETLEIADDMFGAE